jgi:hypothetical protein
MSDLVLKRSVTSHSATVKFPKELMIEAAS